MSHDGALARLRAHIETRIIGQQGLIERLLIALLADGHLLVEGAPGLAKTRAIKALAEGVEADFHRLQFTPDLLPSDLIGTDIYRPQTGSFEFQHGPIFHNPLPELFLVMATQNPIEQEGTYPLPEAQLDRFLMHVRVGYPDRDAELKIMRLARGEARHEPSASIPRLTQQDIFDARQAVLELHLSEAVEQYIVELVHASREPAAYGADLVRWIDFGASPRASIALERCARAHAWLAGRDYVSPDDVQALAPDVLRHRILRSYAAEAEGVDDERLVSELLNRVPVA